jgi:hypothetical protein
LRRSTADQNRVQTARAGACVVQSAILMRDAGPRSEPISDRRNRFERWIGFWSAKSSLFDGKTRRRSENTGIRRRLTAPL